MNEFREWLSDNLRYIMLGVGILLGLVIIFFGIRFITSAVDPNPDKQIESNASTDQTPTPSVTVTPTPTPIEVLVLEELVENGVPEITSLIQDYYTALASNDLDRLRMLVDNLTIEDEAIIVADTVTAYYDIRVFTKVSETPGVYIVFASYKYQLTGINTPVPGLTQLCVHTANDGSLYVSTAGPNAALQLEIDQTMKTTEVQNLIDNVQTQYETAINSDTALYAYFHGSSSTSSTNSSNTNSTGSNTSGTNSGNTNSTNTNSGTANNSSNTSNGTNATPTPTWTPDSVATVDPEDGGIIPPPEAPKERQLVLKEKAMLYSSASTTGGTIRSYPVNTQMVKLEEIGDFYYVTINGEKGYMLKSAF